jgi:hypothetical protein
MDHGIAKGVRRPSSSRLEIELYAIRLAYDLQTVLTWRQKVRKPVQSESACGNIRDVAYHFDE